MTDPLVTVEPLDGPVAGALVAAMVAELRVRYADDGAAGAALDPAAFRPPTGTFLVATVVGERVGCGGLRTREPGTGEVKRMYVAPSARGRGVGRGLLAALEAAAADLGMSRLVLETGTAQPEAMALYAAADWQPIERYGEWRHAAGSRCYGKRVG